MASIWPEKLSTHHLQLTILHSVIGERLGYSGVGWSQQYDFTTSDIRAAFKMFEKLKKFPNLMSHMLKHIIYGSRMNNHFDDELLKELIEKGGGG